MNARTPGLWFSALGLMSILSACQVEQGPPMPVPAEARGPQPTDTPAPHPGQAPYERFCAACHGSDGIAKASDWTPNLNSQGLLTVVDDAFLYDSTALGRPGPNGRGQKGTKMSAFADLMTEEELQLVVDYMRAWQTEPSQSLAPFTATGDAAAGRRIYDVTCASCHGTDGWGDLAPRLAGEIFQRTYSDALIRHVVLHGRPGSRMPPHLLTDQELNDVVTHVRALGRAAVTATPAP